MISSCALAMGRFPKHEPMVEALLATSLTAASTAAVSVPRRKSMWLPLLQLLPQLLTGGPLLLPL
jgi:hypothetical protein